jgi:hypothetical protein
MPPYPPRLTLGWSVVGFSDDVPVAWFECLHCLHVCTVCFELVFVLFALFVLLSIIIQLQPQGMVSFTYSALSNYETFSIGNSLD